MEDRLTPSEPRDEWLSGQGYVGCQRTYVDGRFLRMATGTRGPAGGEPEARKRILDWFAEREAADDLYPAERAPA